MNHTALRDRVAAYKQGNEGKPHVPAFIELDMNAPHTASECIIEMEKLGGTKMKITVKGNHPDIAGINKAFLG